MAMESVRWGDAVENEEDDREFYHDSVDHVEKKVRVRTVTRRKHRDVERRKNWKRFGECAGKPPGPEAGVTILGDEVFLESSLSKKKEVADKDSLSMGIVCRLCGIVGDHWTLKCPYKEQLKSQKPGAAPSEEAPQGGPSDSSRPSKYVAPGIRNKMGDGDSRGGRQVDDPTVRVTNLSEDTKESDLYDLFSPFGVVKRVFLAKYKQTGLTKGFAFVTYARREDAARAIEQLSGYGYDHLILHLEWARPAAY
eukprot:CAMPEP_0201488342 /NCGR_PEP_ID=MMETSP0151_2-20130828/17902_1 /ASSEMBLY_ACC=CAM_ASM_000257 /TAXON_ID=200890 /ORGANISM="Paramoeba atlantica, Strain 621/1 / CCAP 1560/9" /LENGTH=251 /DNA_ID=CAMNT_0047873609 /DNA_START=75 /DNA_END=830 /DNA_ORIENTATION=-